jgi:hypothetical protein
VAGVAGSGWICWSELLAGVDGGGGWWSVMMSDTFFLLFSFLPLSLFSLHPDSLSLSFSSSLSFVTLASLLDPSMVFSCFSYFL